MSPTPVADHYPMMSPCCDERAQVWSGKHYVSSPLVRNPLNCSNIARRNIIGWRESEEPRDLPSTVTRTADDSGDQEATDQNPTGTTPKPQEFRPPYSECGDNKYGTQVEEMRAPRVHRKVERYNKRRCKAGEHLLVSVPSEQPRYTNDCTSAQTDTHQCNRDRK